MNCNSHNIYQILNHLIQLKYVVKREENLLFYLCYNFKQERHE